LILDITPIKERVDINSVIARTPAAARYDRITDFIEKKRPIITQANKRSVAAWNRIVKIFNEYGVVVDRYDKELYCIGVYVGKYLVCIDTPDIPAIPHIPREIVLVDENETLRVINLRKRLEKDRRVGIGATRRVYVTILSNLIRAFVLSVNE